MQNITAPHWLILSAVIVLAASGAVGQQRQRCTGAASVRQIIPEAPPPYTDINSLSEIEAKFQVSFDVNRTCDNSPRLPRNTKVTITYQYKVRVKKDDSIKTRKGKVVEDFIPADGQNPAVVEARFAEEDGFKLDDRQYVSQIDILDASVTEVRFDGQPGTQPSARQGDPSDSTKTGFWFCVLSVQWRFSEADVTTEEPGVPRQSAVTLTKPFETRLDGSLVERKRILTRAFETRIEKGGWGAGALAGRGACFWNLTEEAARENGKAMLKKRRDILEDSCKRSGRFSFCLDPDLEFVIDWLDHP